MDMHQKIEGLDPELVNANLKSPAPSDDQFNDLAERRFVNSERVVNQLSQAILACILRYVREPSNFSSETPLFSLMQVCHHWREVIWDEPILVRTSLFLWIHFRLTGPSQIVDES